MCVFLCCEAVLAQNLGFREIVRYDNPGKRRELGNSGSVGNRGSTGSNSLVGVGSGHVRARASRERHGRVAPRNLDSEPPEKERKKKEEMTISTSIPAPSSSSTQIFPKTGCLDGDSSSHQFSAVFSA